MADRTVIDPDLAFIRHLQETGGDTLKKCYQCATCSTVCELSPAEKPFPRKEMIWAQWGWKDRLLRDPDVWLCHQCNDCSTSCPRDARPGDVLAAVRDYIYSSFTIPSFMGKALANPGALPLLLLVPMIIIAAVIGINMMANGHGLDYYFGSEEVMLTEFIPAGYTEMLFISGNILIFIIAGIGLWRFWKGLTHGSAQEGGPGFVAALIATVVEIITHKRFGQCGKNHPRQLAHLAVLFGFLGAAMTAGLSLFFSIVMPEWFHSSVFVETPIDLPHPIKILGAASGVLVVFGSLWMVVRRAINADAVGANGYPDHLFLWMIFVVGLTGMFSWLLRYWGIGTIAYPMYYAHIVTVFFLLWYMPYSKFAHMLYRTMAMVWARQHKRILGERPVAQLPAAEAVTEVAVSAA